MKEPADRTDSVLKKILEPGSLLRPQTTDLIGLLLMIILFFIVDIVFGLESIILLIAAAFTAIGIHCRAVTRLEKRIRSLEEEKDAEQGS